MGDQKNKPTLQFASMYVARVVVCNMT